MNFTRIVFLLYFILFGLNFSYSQTISCTRELSTLQPADTNNQNWVVPTSGTTCVSSNITIAFLEIANGGTLIIKPGVLLTITGGVRPDNIPARTSTIEVYGELRFTQPATIPMSTNLTVYSAGKVTVGNNGTNNLTFRGNTTKVLNNGIFACGTIDFTNGSSNNTFENQGTCTISGNINVSGTTQIKNTNTLNISSSFNNNANSIYVNCGTFTTQGFNLNGGKIYNIGTFSASGAINFGSASAFFENYGTFNGTSIQLGGGTSYVYNSGNFTLSNVFQNDGNLRGPTTGSNYGRFTIGGKSSMNNGSVTGLLNLINGTNANSNASTMFNNGIAIGPLVVFGSCPSCTNITTGAICLNPDGSIPTTVNAVADNLSATAEQAASGASNIGNVLSNDTFNNGVSVAATTNNVNISVTTVATPLSQGAPVPTLNITTGEVAVPPGTPAGTYTIIYQICDKSGTPCDSAAIEIIVQAPTFCYEPAVIDNTEGGILLTPVGISTLSRTQNASGWPGIRKSGWIVLEAKTKGFVLNRVQFNVNNQPVASDGSTLVITNPVEGMMVFDVTNDCLKMYTTTDGINFDWYCMTQQTCP